MADDKTRAEQLQQSSAQLDAAMAKLNGPTEAQKRADEQARFPGLTQGQASYAASLNMPK